MTRVEGASSRSEFSGFAQRDPRMDKFVDLHPLDTVWFAFPAAFRGKSDSSPHGGNHSPCGDELRFSNLGFLGRDFCAVAGRSTAIQATRRRRPPLWRCIEQRRPIPGRPSTGKSLCCHLSIPCHRYGEPEAKSPQRMKRFSRPMPTIASQDSATSGGANISKLSSRLSSLCPQVCLAVVWWFSGSAAASVSDIGDGAMKRRRTAE